MNIYANLPDPADAINNIAETLTPVGENYSASASLQESPTTTKRAKALAFKRGEELAL